MRVLIGVDGSEGSHAALDFACRILNPAIDELLMVYSPPGVGHARAVTLEPVQHYLADAVFSRALQHCTHPMTDRVSSMACHVEPTHGLMAVAMDRDCEMIVVGARGTGPLREPPLGRVASHLVDQASLPVLVVRVSDATEPARPLNVLLASDGTRTSRHAAEVLARLTWPPRSVGWAMTVLEHSIENGIPDWLLERLDEEQLAALGMGEFHCDASARSRTQTEAAQWYGELPAIFADREPIVRCGNAAHAILAAVTEHSIDLAVVGARRSGPVRRNLLGSTSFQVVRHARCSVLVVRGRTQ